MAQPPIINGIIELNDIQKIEIKNKLEEIKNRPMKKNKFGEEVKWDLFQITATYNNENVGNEINGDTAQMCLIYGETSEEV